MVTKVALPDLSMMLHSVFVTRPTVIKWRELFLSSVLSFGGVASFADVVV